MKPTIPAADLDQVRAFVAKALDRRFHDDGLVFDPIYVTPDEDWEGDATIRVTVIFKGDQRRLDSSWTVGLGVLLRPELARLGITARPRHSFIEKSEWEEQPDANIVNSSP
ncbi:MAG: hypothetical protein F4089_00215 [Gammaproteobacteria bacterium]|nr:hypothetical protein [Gammaproteobacteria bacterium]MYJ73587.1 hypothetical protein [Gammaproteobacteria bacterium]